MHSGHFGKIGESSETNVNEFAAQNKRVKNLSLVSDFSFVKLLLNFITSLFRIRGFLDPSARSVTMSEKAATDKNKKVGVQQVAKTVTAKVRAGGTNSLATLGTLLIDQEWKAYPLEGKAELTIVCGMDNMERTVKFVVIKSRLGTAGKNSNNNDSGRRNGCGSSAIAKS
ncbi:hypothetical protein CLF_100050 [Clonorchis sinensis]|uniref:Uncharacterized protein n=1 Tax=Clonorchis sinensis TaxID=79923 RepID=G7Y2J1_CLOSI|nr:hypothetical protein CLF_100050 [Clonorchis sinensis]